MAAQIRRKPVPVSPSADIVQSPTSISADETDDDALFESYGDQNVQSVKELSIQDRPEPTPVQQVTTSKTEPVHSKSSTSKSASKVAQATGKAFVSAYGEVRHFAGGLLAHPVESTKHYSILRHSHGVVWYTGSYTNLAITVFADRELSPDRSFWLQRKGWSGKTGLRAGVLFGAKGAWIDVTPSVRATPDQVKASDERAWQRDMGKFLRKAPKKLSNHQPRETEILRIPCEADDGYLRVVMCAGERGKKTLCPSPVFRLASTTTSASSMRGASLRTLPIEAAIKAGSVIGHTAANTFIGPYVDTARSFVNDQLTSVYQPSAIAQTAATTAYDHSGVPDRVDNMNEHYDSAREASHQLGDAEMAGPGPVQVIGDDSGPASPFPVRFHGKVVPGNGHSMEVLGIPTANLSSVDSNIMLRHSGIYFGWAAINAPKKMQAELNIDDDWFQALISIVTDPDSQAGVVQRKVVLVHILEDLDNVKFYGAKLSVIMMGYLRPVFQPQHGQQEHPEFQIFNLDRDIAVTTASLSRPAWQADETLERVKSAASGRSLTERYVDARQSTQNSIDKVPVHKLGVRTQGAGLKDRFVGNGGICIPR